MLPPSKVTGKLILVPASMATDVALERILVAMATHVYGVKHIVGEVDVAVGAVMQKLWFMPPRGGRARLTIGAAVGGCAGSVAAVAGVPRPVPDLGRGCERGRRAGDNGRGRLDQEDGLLIGQRVGPRGGCRV